MVVPSIAERPPPRAGDALPRTPVAPGLGVRRDGERMSDETARGTGAGDPPRAGVGVCGLILATDVDEPTAAAAVSAAMGVARDMGGALVALDLPLRALVVAPYPARRETRLAISGEIQDGTAPIVAGALSATLARMPGLLMVDLRRTESIDEGSAMGLGAAAGLMGAWGGVLALWRPTDPVRHVLRRCGLDDLVTPLDDAPVLIA